MSIFENILAIS